MLGGEARTDRTMRVAMLPGTIGGALQLQRFLEITKGYSTLCIQLNPTQTTRRERTNSRRAITLILTATIVRAMVRRISNVHKLPSEPPGALTGVAEAVSVSAEVLEEEEGEAQSNEQ